LFNYALAKEKVVLLVNNLGSTTGLELSVATKRAVEQLQNKHNLEVFTLASLFAVGGVHTAH
jgi:dihydroxyacetone kinase